MLTNGGNPLRALRRILNGPFLGGFVIGAATLLAVAVLLNVADLDVSLKSAPPPTLGPEDEFHTLEEVWHVLRNGYVEKDSLDQGALEREAIQGMLDAVGDPYTVYIPPGHFGLELEDLSGQYEGIGATVGMREGLPVIIAPMPGSPAERAGILPGDTILEVDGQTTEGMNLLEVIMLVRGPEGEAVELLVRHRGEAEPVPVSVVRDIITISSVDWRVLDDGIGYLHLAAFQEDTPVQVERGLKALKDQNIESLVLDLRNNPGGLLTAVVDVAGEFLSDGLVLFEVNGDGERTDWNARNGGLAVGLPMAVLVNSSSASGSEVLAGALAAHGRAVVIGTQTFGKGSVNLLQPLSDGSGLRYTVARWYTPDGLLIEGAGLEPDIVVDQPADVAPGTPEDVQLQRAISELRHSAVASLAR